MPPQVVINQNFISETARPVVREYWKAVLNNSLLCEIYFDNTTNQWFVERVYD